MFPNVSIHLIASYCYYFDGKCREDLTKNLITSERDYVSRFLTFISYPFGPFFQVKFLIAKSLSQSEEQKFGCDGLIIFKKNNELKIGLFESKWPRYFSNPKYAWDKPTRNANSRFSTQIVRQRNWRNKAAIWIMFFNESDTGTKSSPFDKYGSTCIWHELADTYMTTNNLQNRSWDNNDLLNLLRSRPNNYLLHDYSYNLRHIIYKFLSCKQGIVNRIQPSDNSIVMRGIDDSQVRIPLEFNSNMEQLESFFEETGLRYYALVDIK